MKKLLLLHGALGSAIQFKELSQELADDFEVFTFDFEGHGGKPSDKGFSIALFGENLMGFVKDKNLQGCLVFAYSMGGYVALKIAASHPELFNQIITLGTKFNWNSENANREAAQLNPTKIREKVPQFAQYQALLHVENQWVSVIQKTAAMMLDMGQKPPLTETDLNQINIPVSLLLGAKDQMVSEEESVWAHKNLSNARFEIIPDWPHPIERIPVQELVEALRKFA